MECGLQCGECAVDDSELVGGTESVRAMLDEIRCVTDVRTEQAR